MKVTLLGLVSALIGSNAMLLQSEIVEPSNHTVKEVVGEYRTRFLITFLVLMGSCSKAFTTMETRLIGTMTFIAVVGAPSDSSTLPSSFLTPFRHTIPPQFLLSPILTSPQTLSPITSTGEMLMG